MEKRRWERPRTRITRVCPRLAQVRVVGGVIERLSQDFRDGVTERHCGGMVCRV
jgi:hypothetical protein